MLAPSRQAVLREALEHLVSALELLDRGAAPGDIGAHVDHARERLEGLLDGAARPSPETGSWT
jgi:hypothetical protein